MKSRSSHQPCSKLKVKMSEGIQIRMLADCRSPRSPEGKLNPDELTPKRGVFKRHVQPKMCVFVLVRVRALAPGPCGGVIKMCFGSLCLCPSHLATRAEACWSLAGENAWLSSSKTVEGGRILERGLCMRTRISHSSRSADRGEAHKFKIVARTTRLWSPPARCVGRWWNLLMTGPLNLLALRPFPPPSWRSCRRA